MNKIHYVVVANHDLGGSSAFDHLSDIVIKSAQDYLNLEKEVRSLFAKRKDAAGFQCCTLTITPVAKEFRTTAFLSEKELADFRFILPTDQVEKVA